MILKSLDGIYKGTGIKKDGGLFSFEAKVPGCVHTDLIRNKTIQNLFYKDNAADYEWLETCDFEFVREFEIDTVCGDEFIQFEGLDVFCDIFLNDIKIGSAEDMFFPWSFETKGALRTGTNLLKIKFCSALSRPGQYGAANDAAFTADRLSIRRIQCTFGWDWVHRFVTCGIWKSVNLCCLAEGEVQSVYVSTAFLDEQGAQIDLHCEFPPATKSGFTVLIELFSPEGKKVFSKERVVIEPKLYEAICVAYPRLWWPNGYGDQPLYLLKLSFGGHVLHEAAFGIRTLRILQETDSPDNPEHKKSLWLKKARHLQEYDRNTEFSSFCLVINGAKIMCKGANWVPPEPFPSDAADAKYEELIRLAGESGLNMLRVWGGGVFEQELFYDLCDRHGILVVQDLLMACGYYPEQNERFRELLSREAAYAAVLLRNHPCLAFWVGDNENGGLGAENTIGYNGRAVAYEIARPILTRLDPLRPFLPTSPWGGTPNLSATTGVCHVTSYLDFIREYIESSDLGDFRKEMEKYLSRFCAEMPTYGAPALTGLKKFMSEEDIYSFDEMWRFHIKNHPSPSWAGFGALDVLTESARKYLGEFNSPDDQLYKMQYIQYEWVRITLEAYRRNKWYSSGLLFWMYNDCWPASCWAFVDYYGIPKASYYAFKRCAKPLIAAIDERDGVYQVYLCNDSLTAHQGTMELYVQDSQEKIILHRDDFLSPANQSVVAFEFQKEKYPSLLNENALLLCEIQGEFGEDTAIFVPRRLADLSLESANIKVIEQNESNITLITDKYVHSVRLEGEFVFSDNYFPLFPGKSKTVQFTNAYTHSSDQISISPLL